MRPDPGQILPPNGLSPRAVFSLGCMLVVCALCAPGCRYWNGFLKPVGPDYLRPAVPVADRWLEFNDPRVISSAQGVDDQAWWRLFGDPHMDRLMQLAYEQNLPIRIAALRVMEARYQRQIAASYLFPQAQQVAGEYERIQISRAEFPYNLRIFRDIPRSFDRWRVGFDASWELDVWGKFRRNVESNQAQLDSSIEHYDDVLVSLIAEVAATYIEIRIVQQQLVLARSNVEIQKSTLEIAEQRFAAGAASELDVTQAQSILADTEATIPELQIQLQQANNRLCTLLGSVPQDLLADLGDGPIPVPPDQIAVGIPADLIRRRPDVRQAEREAAAQSARIGIAASDLYPQFVLSGAIGLNSHRLNNLFSSKAVNGFVAPSFTWDVLNYGRLVDEVAIQDARFKQAVVNYQQSVLLANEEVEDALVAFLNSQQVVQDLFEAVEASKKSVDLATQQYQDGAASFDRVFLMESFLTRQQNLLAEAQGAVALNLVAVYKALGGGWQIRLNLPAAAPPLPEELPIAPANPAVSGGRTLSNDDIEAIATALARRIGAQENVASPPTTANLLPPELPADPTPREAIISAVGSDVAHPLRAAGAVERAAQREGLPVNNLR